MKYFLDRVRAKSLDPAEPPVLLVALGDSVTQGVMEHRRLGSKEVFHRVFQEKLEDFFPTTTFSTINAGASGETVERGAMRLERDVIRHDPDLVIVAFGLNDSLGGEDGRPLFSATLREMVGRIREATRADIILMTPPMMARRHSYRIHPDHEQIAPRIIAAQCDGVLAAYAQSIRDVAEDTGCVLVDVHAAWSRQGAFRVDTDLWLANGLNHPDRRGHQLAAELLFHSVLSRV